MENKYNFSFSNEEAFGFSDESTENKNYIMKEIPSKIAREVVKKFHYSGKVVNNSRLHLGVFEKDTHKLCGVLQYGYPMNPERTPGKLVEGSTKLEMYELNRMAMYDDAPKMSESQAIGLSFKWIKRFKPEIKWLLSFSDGKEGNVGTIYQATNWEYYGYRLSDSFYDLDGEIMHSVPVYNKFRQHDTTGRTQSQILYDIFDNVKKIVSRQHIYIIRLDKKVKVNGEIKPYPKKETEPTIVKEIIYKENGVVLPQRKIVEYV